MTVACDSSVVIPAVSPWHPDHEVVAPHIEDVSAVPVHVVAESYAVLTRLPPPYAATPGEVLTVLGGFSWRQIILRAEDHFPTIQRLGSRGVRGGAVYDGLIGATAAAHGLTLLTRDRRARRTYDALGIDYRML